VFPDEPSTIPTYSFTASIRGFACRGWLKKGKVGSGAGMQVHILFPFDFPPIVLFPELLHRIRLAVCMTDDDSHFFQARRFFTSLQRDGSGGGSS
jgi:hypothetical protein